MNSKLVFNFVIFFLTGIVSLLRSELAAVVVSFSFAFIFFVLNFFLKDGKEGNMIEQYD